MSDSQRIKTHFNESFDDRSGVSEDVFQAFFRPKEVGDHRELAAFNRGEINSRTACGKDAPGNRRRLQIRVNRLFNTD